MALFYMGLVTGLLLGIALVTIVVLIYTSCQSQDNDTEHSVEEVEQWIPEISIEERQEDCEGCEMNLEEPLIPQTPEKEIPPSTVGDAEVRRRFTVLREKE